MTDPACADGADGENFSVLNHCRGKGRQAVLFQMRFQHRIQDVLRARGGNPETQENHCNCT